MSCYIRFSNITNFFTCKFPMAQIKPEVSLRIFQLTLGKFLNVHNLLEVSYRMLKSYRNISKIENCNLQKKLLVNFPQITQPKEILHFRRKDRSPCMWCLSHSCQCMLFSCHNCQCILYLSYY